MKEYALREPAPEVKMLFGPLQVAYRLQVLKSISEEMPGLFTDVSIPSKKT